MKKFEYAALYYHPKTDVDILNELGDQGFELIQIISAGDDTNSTRWIFKREKIEKVTAVDGD